MQIWAQPEFRKMSKEFFNYNNQNQHRAFLWNIFRQVFRLEYFYGFDQGWVESTKFRIFFFFFLNLVSIILIGTGKNAIFCIKKLIDFHKKMKFKISHSTF